MKVVINRCFGGFSLSNEAEKLYGEKSGFEVFFYKENREKNIYQKVSADSDAYMLYTFKKDHGDSFTEFPEDGSYWYSRETPRDDLALIEVVEELKDKASGVCAELEVVEIPDGISWGISDYDGNESVK